jgi:di/tricarboxylate transporter
VGRDVSIEAAWTLLIIAIALAALVREYMSPDLVTLGALGVLVVTGVVDLESALLGFANPTLLAIASLFVVAAGLRSTGVLDRATQALLGVSSDLGRALFRLTSVTGVGSAFLSNTSVIAMGMPAVVKWARNRGISPSKLLIPLSFASILGGTSTLLGTSTNLVADGLLRSHGFPGLGFFELAAVGVPVLVLGVAYLVLVAPRLLPDRPDVVAQRRQAEREEVEMRVESSSPLVGRRVREMEGKRWQEEMGVEFVRAERRRPVAEPVRRGEKLQEGDRLTLRGEETEQVVERANRLGMHRVEASDRSPLDWEEEEFEAREAVIPEGSTLVGETLEETNFRNRYRANVTGVVRNGAYVKGPLNEVAFRPGDCLLLEGRPGFTEAFQDVTEFVLVERVDEVEEEEAAEEPERPILAMVILTGVVVLSVLEIMHISLAALFGGLAMVGLGLLTPAEARRSVDWSVLIVIGAALGLATAVEASGAADVVARALVEAGAVFGPMGVLGATVLATMLFTVVITNNAVVALMFPIGLAAAATQGVDPRPFVVAVTVSASISLVTPLGYQTNLMVYGPGGYRFSDFFRVGFPLQLATAVVILAVVPLVWPF